MRIDFSVPGASGVSSSPQLQAENRQLIQAVRAVNASGSLGENELTFVLDPRSQRPIIRIVNRQTQEIVEQIPNETALRLFENLKTPG